MSAELDGLQELMVVKCLETIRDNADDSWNVESRRKASYLHIGTISFPFIVTLIVVSRCLEVTCPLTVQLQESAIDAGAAREKVSRLYVHLEKMRHDDMNCGIKKQSPLQSQSKPSHKDQE